MAIETFASESPLAKETGSSWAEAIGASMVIYPLAAPYVIMPRAYVVSCVGSSLYSTSSAVENGRYGLGFAVAVLLVAIWRR